MKMQPSIKALLGFAQRAGSLLTGEAAVENGLKRGQVSLIILAEDLPEKRKQHTVLWCQDIGMEFLVLGNKKDIGYALGLSPRGMIGVKDRQMAKAIIKKYYEENQILPNTNGGD